MKSILRKAALIAVIASAAFGIMGCSDSSSDDTPEKKTFDNCVPGDFVLKDMSILSKDTTLTDEQKSNVAAVIFRAKNGSKPALGCANFHVNYFCLMDNTAIGVNTDITALKGDLTSGCMDGSNCVEELKKVCSDYGSAYTVYYSCDNYGSQKSFPGELASGWYLPAVAELKTIYDNMTVVNESFVKAGQEAFSGTYVSCSQNADKVTSNNAFNFTTGIMTKVGKSYQGYFSPVRAFK